MISPRLTAAAVATLLVAAVPSVPSFAAGEPAPVSGAQTSGDSLFPGQGNGGYDVRHYDLDLRYGRAGRLSATTTITARTTDAPLSDFSLDLEGLSVTSVTVDGAPAEFSRVDADPTFKLVVTPATPVDGAFEVVVAYRGTPVSHTDPDDSSEGWNVTRDGAIALNEPVGAMTFYPNNNTPSDKATFTTRIRIPDSLGSAISNGRPAGVRRHADDTSTFTWRQPRQQATYLSLIGIGRYQKLTRTHALTDGTVREWSYVDPAVDDRQDTVAAVRGRLGTVLRRIERLYGTYPGAATGVVVDAVPGGVNYALETQDRPFFPGPIDLDTFVHELAHQWFGNAVSPADWGDVWLNEGPATFIATQVRHQITSSETPAAVYHRMWENTPADSARWQTPVAGFDDASQLFGWQVYNRGAMTLTALRVEIGAAAFDRLMRGWIAERSGGSATTADFIAAAEKASGQDLTAFFDDWVYGTDKPAWPGEVG